MDFMHYDLGNLQKGHFVEVVLQRNVVNVRLLDDESFQDYKDGDSYYYIGGRVQMSPVYLKVPQTGHWHLVIDAQGLYTSLENGRVRLLLNPPPTMQNLMNRIMYNDGKEITEVYDRTVPLKNKYDIFISFVPEDRGDVARPLAHYLTQKGVPAGFEEFEIKDGGWIESLDKGLSNCRYGIVIISRNMILKRWKAYEWESAAAKITSGLKPVFPVWHNVNQEEIAEYSKSLSKKPARWTGRSSIETIASEIAGIIRS
ncbi:MAG: DUF1883 domain-containing protein [Oscillospiraceae bacterium]|nr:DUF1883 domain-containing protein [Oscillospiraceae bacterium]